jgi:regulator of RNase E activity RraB
LQNAQSAERPFFLNLIRSDPVTSDHINAIVADLVELAERFGGDYDGWGCEVRKTRTA